MTGRAPPARARYRRLLDPPRRGSTYRCAVFLLLGAVVALPYVLIVLVLVRFSRDPDVPLPALLALVLLAAGLGTVPAFLGGTRAMEIAAVRWLLGVDLPDPPAGGAAALSTETRLRAALWFAVHLAVGAAFGLVLLLAAPLTLLLLLAAAGLTGPGPAVAAAPPGPGTAGAVGGALLGAAVLVVLLYAAAGLGALASVLAPVLLGPSSGERIAALEAANRRLAERNRLAGELHDSVGHALTVTVLQAGAARYLFDSDPGFVRRALASIEDSGRAAMADLDHVLGLLRDRVPAPARPGRTLADLERLVGEAAATGRSITLAVDGPVAAVPAALSREGYRIAQEGMTNALRHAGPVPVALRLVVEGGMLAIEVDNPLGEPGPQPDAAARTGGAGSAADRGGLGLAGMRQRVHLLGGRMAAGPDGSRWRLRAELPLDGAAAGQPGEGGSAPAPPCGGVVEPFPRGGGAAP